MALPPHAPRRRPPAFRPSFTLAALYLLAFFAIFSMLFVLPELLTVLRDSAPGPEQQRLAQEIVHRVAGPRLPWAMALALGALGLGAYLQVLPGLRRR